MKYLSRRLLMLLAIVVTTIGVSPDARGEDDLPPLLIAQLVRKVTAFDKNFAARWAARPRALVVHKADDDRSIRQARLIQQSLSEAGESGPALPVDLVSYRSAIELATLARERGVSLVVMASGLEPEMPTVASAFAGKDMLTLGTSGALVERGAVVGFELRAGKPKVVVNLTSARAQNVAFRADFLNLARIVQ